MTQPNWETVEVPRGAFLGWGDKVGQHVTGYVLEYDVEGGTDYYNKVCPRIDIELVEPAASFNKEGDRTDYPAGEFVVLNAGLVSLKRALRAADPHSGDLIKIVLSNLVKTANGTVKEMNIKIARNARPSRPASASTNGQSASGFGGAQPQAEPPF